MEKILENREFKFRIWDRRCGFFCENMDWKLSLDGELLKICRGYMEDGVVDRDRFVIQQFTGCLDKKGKEIYEGDIVKFHNFIFEIVYDLRDMRFLGRDKLQNEVCYLVPNNLEVIGNIFENPELLTQEQNEQI